jgi:trimeric autotransporter adhesin
MKRDLQNRKFRHFRQLTTSHIFAILLLALLPMTEVVHAQNVAINADGSLPNANAMLDIKSGNKGLLIPRMSTEARLRIPHTQGLLVYDVTTNSFWYNTGRSWQNMAAGASLLSVADSAWLLTGNSGTNDNTHFIGTSDNVPFNVRVNNQRSGRIDHITRNTFWGYTSGFSITTGNDNTGIGASALYALTTGYNNTAVGSNALQSNNTGHHNSAFGRFALMSNTTGYNNAANGTGSLFSNTTGRENTATGVNALYQNTTGSNNTASGAWSLAANTTGENNTAVGTGALSANSTEPDNTAIGAKSLYANSGGHENTATGVLTLTNNTDGFANTAMGSRAMSSNLTGPGNAAFGAYSMTFNTTGEVNTAIGAYSMQTNTTGNFNTLVGGFTTVSAGNLTNATSLGFGALVNASNKVRIGNAAVTVIEGQVPFTFPSDGRFKFQVQDDVKGLDFILQLRPVTYRFDTKSFDAAQRTETASAAGNNLREDKLQTATWKKAQTAMDAAYEAASNIRRSGFIAQEVEEAARKSAYNFSGIIAPGKEQQHYSLSYDAFVVPLVKAVQEQQQMIDSQNKKLAAQEQQIQEQNKKIAGMQQRLDELIRLLK